jgi:hypothetical protein
MAFFWIFRMGYSRRSGDPQPQTTYRFLEEGRPSDLQLRADGERPHYTTVWTQVSTSDPWGYSTGTSPDFLVGRYGNWWGAQWSGGRVCGFDGIGPTDCPYVDALDRIAIEHDIECWIAGEVNRNPALGIQAGDVFRIQEVVWEGSVGPREYVYESQLAPHVHARGKMAHLPLYLRERLKASIFLYTILSTPLDVNDMVDASLARRSMDAAGKTIMLRPDWGCKAAITLLGLTSVSMTLGDLMRFLRNAPGNHIPLSASEVLKIKARLRALRGSDAIMREILQGLQ